MRARECVCCVRHPVSLPRLCPFLFLCGPSLALFVRGSAAALAGSLGVLSPTAARALSVRRADQRSAIGQEDKERALTEKPISPSLACLLTDPTHIHDDHVIFQVLKPIASHRSEQRMSTQKENIHERGAREKRGELARLRTKENAKLKRAAASLGSSRSSVASARSETVARQQNALAARMKRIEDA